MVSLNRAFFLLGSVVGVVIVVVCYRRGYIPRIYYINLRRWFDGFMATLGVGAFGRVELVQIAGDIIPDHSPRKR